MLSPSVVSNSLRPHRLQPPRLLCPWGFSRQEYSSRLPCPSLGDLPNPGIEPRSSTLQVDSSPYELPRKPMNTGVDSQPIQGIFPTQESNWGLLHCRQILLPAELPGKSRQTVSGLLFSRGSPWPRDQTHISGISFHWQVGCLPLSHLGIPSIPCCNF